MDFILLTINKLKLTFKNYLEERNKETNLNYYSPALFIYCTKTKFFRINISFFSITTRILKFLIIINFFLFIILIQFTKIIVIDIFILWILLFVYSIIFLFLLYCLNILYINNKIFNKNT